MRAPAAIIIPCMHFLHYVIYKDMKIRKSKPVYLRHLTIVDSIYKHTDYVSPARI